MAESGYRRPKQGWQEWLTKATNTTPPENNIERRVEMSQHWATCAVGECYNFPQKEWLDRHIMEHRGVSKKAESAGQEFMAAIEHHRWVDALALYEIIEAEARGRKR